MVQTYPCSLAGATALHRLETDRSAACEAIPGLPERLSGEKSRGQHGASAARRLRTWACTAASLLVAAGDNPDRLRSEAAWPHLCGVAPIEASSAKTKRYRLNRRGDRQANAALWRSVITRMSSGPRTQATGLPRGAG